MLPFTAEVFFALFDQYNRTVWPAQPVAYALAAGAVALAMRPVRGSDRFIGAVLAAAWLWNGVVYHIGYFATINFAAPVFGLLFIVQGALFAWTVALRGSVAFRWQSSPIGWCGLAMVVYAMAI